MYTPLSTSMVRTLLIRNKSLTTAISIVEKCKDKSGSKLGSCIKWIALGIGIKVGCETLVSKVLLGWGRDSAPPLIYGIGIRGGNHVSPYRLTV